MPHSRISSSTLTSGSERGSSKDPLKKQQDILFESRREESIIPSPMNSIFVCFPVLLLICSSNASHCPDSIMYTFFINKRIYDGECLCRNRMSNKSSCCKFFFPCKLPWKYLILKIGSYISIILYIFSQNKVHLRKNWLSPCPYR